MSVKIESTGLFVEAAYGQEGIPGLDGVTGQGESHDIAWKQALSDAALQLPETQLKSPAGQINSAQERLDGLPANMGGQDNPVSWDRLSMTVASMVAWNMSIEMADDVLAESIEGGSVGDVVSEEGVLLSSSKFDDSDLALVDSGVDLNQLVFDLAATPAESHGPAEVGEPDVGHPAESELHKNKASTAAPEVAEMDQRPKPEESVIFREGSEVNQSLEGMQSASTDTREVGSQYPMDVRVGTTSGNAANSIMKGLANAPGSEIPPTYQMGHTHTPESTGPDGKSSQAVSTLPKLPTVNGKDPMDAVVRVRSSSSGVNPEVEAGKQRLAAIRQVLGQLENQAKMNAIASEVRDVSQDIQQDQGAVSKAIVTKSPVQSLDPGNVTKNTKGPLTQTHPQQSSNKTSADNGVDDIRTFGTVAEEGETLDELSRPSLPKARLEPIEPARGTLRTLSKVGVETPTTQTEFNAAIAGSENAEIASDELTFLEGIEFDAENIDANEVPELAVQDTSQLDVDIDDAAGTVRLEMSRDGEEISIRMETPQEVLDSYRDMEEEMGGALADQGLDLSQFSAEAQDPDGDEALGQNEQSNQKEESRRGGVHTGSVGAQELEQTGGTARLVNHIV